MVQRQFYSDSHQYLALYPPRRSDDQPPPCKCHENGPENRWLTPPYPTHMKEGDILLFGLGIDARGRGYSLEITEKFFRRWELLLEVINSENTGYLASQREFGNGVNLESMPEFSALWEHWEHYFVAGPRNLDMTTGYDGTGRYSSVTAAILSNGYILFILFLLTLVYGRVHLSAWHWTFPTHMERSLWRCSCLYIMLVVPVIYGLRKIVLSFMRNSEKTFTRGRGTYLVVDGLLTYSFLLVRIYIIVEVFLSLRQVSVGAYLSPSWLQMFPHV